MDLTPIRAAHPFSRPPPDAAKCHRFCANWREPDGCALGTDPHLLSYGLSTEPDKLSPLDADEIVAEAARAYFVGCRDRIDFFVERNFSVTGAARLHTRAVGWDLLKAPANVVLSVPQIELKIGAAAARKVGAARRPLDALSNRRLFLETAVASELRWRRMTDLLRLPFTDGDRVSTEDALAEAILTHPGLGDPGGGGYEHCRARVRSRVPIPARGCADGIHRDPCGRRRDHHRPVCPRHRRNRVSEGDTGGDRVGPVIAGSLAQGAAITSFPAGSAAGGIWYGLFPVQAAPVPRRRGNRGRAWRCGCRHCLRRNGIRSPAAGARLAPSSAQPTHRQPRGGLPSQRRGWFPRL